MKGHNGGWGGRLRSRRLREEKKAARTDELVTTFILFLFFTNTEDFVPCEEISGEGGTRVVYVASSAGIFLVNVNVASCNGLRTAAVFVPLACAIVFRTSVRTKKKRFLHSTEKMRYSVVRAGHLNISYLDYSPKPTARSKCLGLYIYMVAGWGVGGSKNAAPRLFPPRASTKRSYSFHRRPSSPALSPCARRQPTLLPCHCPRALAPLSYHGKRCDCCFYLALRQPPLRLLRMPLGRPLLSGHRST